MFSQTCRCTFCRDFSSRPVLRNGAISLFMMALLSYIPPTAAWPPSWRQFISTLIGMSNAELSLVRYFLLSSRVQYICIYVVFILGGWRTKRQFFQYCILSTVDQSIYSGTSLVSNVWFFHPPPWKVLIQVFTLMAMPTTSVIITSGDWAFVVAEGDCPHLWWCSSLRL